MNPRQVWRAPVRPLPQITFPNLSESSINHTLRQRPGALSSLRAGPPPARTLLFANAAAAMFAPRLPRSKTNRRLFWKAACAQQSVLRWMSSVRRWWLPRLLIRSRSLDQSHGGRSADRSALFASIRALKRTRSVIARSHSLLFPDRRGQIACSMN